MNRFLIAGAGAICLWTYSGSFAADEGVGRWPVSKGVDPDTVVVDSTKGIPKKFRTALEPLVPYTGVSSQSPVSWWPVDMGRTFATTEIRTDMTGLTAAPAFWGGVPGLETPGYIWMGIPWTGIQEIGGDATMIFPLSASRIVTSDHPASITGGQRTVFFVPLMDPIISPQTRIQTLRGSHRDRMYALDFGTRATGLISSEVAIGYRETDGDRTNSQTTFKQYDWRVDLQPPVLGPCTILNHYTEIERGIPGPDPSYWDDSDVANSYLSARYWAIEKGYGSHDAMWQQGNETVSTNLLAVRFRQLVRDRIPVNLGIVRDRAAIKTSIIDPSVSDSNVVGVPLNGECTTDRTAFSARITFAENEIDSIWSILSVERIRRESEIVRTIDSVSAAQWDETKHRSILGFGAQLGSTEALFSYIKGADDHCYGSLTSEYWIGEFILSGEFTYGWDERRTCDILRWQTQSYAEPPDYKGELGTFTLGARYPYGGGSIENRFRYGFGNDIWGWCHADSIPAGEYVQWGPDNPTFSGIGLSIDHGLLTWLRFTGDAEYRAWRIGDNHVPGIPDFWVSAALEFDYPIQRRAHPRGGLQIRHVANRFWGLEDTFGTDSYSTLDGWLSVDIGDFTVLVMGRNLTSATYEDMPGYPILGRSIHFGFHWKFWD